MRIMNVMRINNGYLLRNLADEWVVIPIGSATLDFSGLIRVNDAGAFLWRILEHGSERALLIDALLNEYDIDQMTAEKDLDDFLDTLKSHGILTP